MLSLLATYLRRVYQCALHDESPKRMGHKDNRMLRGVARPSVCRELRNQLFGVIMYLIARDAICERRNVCSVAVDQYACLLFLQNRSQKRRGPDRTR